MRNFILSLLLSNSVNADQMFLKVPNDVLAETDDSGTSNPNDIKTDPNVPPTTGKFFYMEFQHRKEGKYEGTIRVGDLSNEMPVWVSS